MKGFLKSELLTIEVPGYNLDAMPGVKHNLEVLFPYHDNEYFVGAHTAGINEKQLMVLRIYEQDIHRSPDSTHKSARRLRWSVYISFEERDFVTYDHRTGGWRDAMVHNLISYGNWYYKNFAYIDDYSRRLAGLFLGEPDRDTLDVISDWQSGIRDNSLQARTARARCKIDALMSQASELPEDIDRYIDDVVMRSHRYSFYRREGKTIHGYCTYCHKDYKITAPKGSLVGKCGVCPLCESEVQYKAEGAAADICDRESFQYACRVSDGMFVSEYSVCQWYSRYKDREHYYRKIAKPYIQKVCRKYISLSGMATTYVYNDNRKKYDSGVKWNKGDGEGICCPLYPDNLQEVIAGTRWQYSALDVYARQIGRVNVERYLMKVYYNPVLERVVKVGLANLVDYVVSNNTHLYDFEINDLRQALGLYMDEIHMLAGIKANADVYILYKVYRRENVRLKADDLVRAQELQICSGLSGDSIAEIRKAVPISRILKYAEAQLDLDSAKPKDVRSWDCRKNILGDWRDYLGECKALGLDWQTDTSLLYPRDLAAAHMSTTERLAAIRLAKFDSGFKKHCKGWERLYTYSDGKYIVRPARSAAELETEGKFLHHCVARYASDMSKGKTLILFVRSAAEPDVPLATGEIRDGNVVQFRAAHNFTPPAPVLKFWEKCQQEFDKRAAESECALGADKPARKGRRNEQRIRAGA